jgi:N-acetylglucosamine-6-phosphate deacetylase
MLNEAQGEICGWHYESRQPVRVRWEAGVITHLESAEPPPTKDIWIAPALFDLQVNGYSGIDFQQDDLTVDDLLCAARRLRAAGCARFLLTVITDDWHRLTGRLRHLRWARSQSAELHAAIAGWHIEGPFLSPEPGFHGAHRPSLMCDPAPEHILELRTITGEDPVLLTVAPERAGALKAISLAVANGMRVSLGHTNASAETLRQAMRMGATAFTHLGNGCPRELDRHDNILWRVLDLSGLVVGLIPDQIHVSPGLFRLVHRVLGPESIYFTADAMSAAGMPPGRYKLGKLELEVGPDQIVRQPGSSLFAGSALRPVEGVFRAAQMLGVPWQNVWPGFSVAPGRLMGLRNELEVQQPANFCVLKLAGENRLLDLQTYLQGML